MAFQIIFQMDLTGDKVNAVVARFQDLRLANKDAAQFAEAMAVGAAGAQEESDAMVRKAAQHWKLERLLSVDRAILRLGIYELAHCPSSPVEVVLDECIELAKLYGSDESAAFVNGLLDSLVKQLRPDEMPALEAKRPKKAVPATPKSTAIPRRKVAKTVAKTKAAGR